MPPAVPWVGLGAISLALVAWLQRRRARKALLTRLRSEWGRLRERRRDMTVISAYHAAVVGPAAAVASIDDRTWDDLNLDSVFGVIDRTESVVGQQVLYSRLRTAPLGRDLDAFEALTCRFSDPPVREDAQMALARLTDTTGYDLWRLARPGALETARWHAVFPVLAGTMIGAIVLIAWWPPAVLAVGAGTVLNLILRGTIADRLRGVTGPFRQVGPLLAVAERLGRVHADDTEPLTGGLAAHVRALAKLRRIANWAGRDTTAALAGDLAALAVEYLNLLLFLDANVLFFGAHELRRRTPELLGVMAAVGDIDAALSVASYRAGTPGWTRSALMPTGAPMQIVGVRHPLLPDAVPNTITLGPPHGVIITGSNMSGKSTFLRTVGVTAVLAQTINTCVADAYQAPPFVVRSCIGRADDPATGRSYYLMEVDAVLDLVRAGQASTPHLMLFDELFRGTNAVERIAAGEAVLVALVPDERRAASAGHIVVAATHDQELVDLLVSSYRPYHFTDRVDTQGLAFDYQLCPGPATTRNAIALLQIRGAPPELVRHALDRAAALDSARQAPALG
jgi:MutS domain V